MDEELLAGGNTHAEVVRIGGHVHRPAGPWTPGVHALLRHLEGAGFDGCPRVAGFDEVGREVLTFVPGDVVYPDHVDLLAPDSALKEVAALIRAFHDAAAGFDAGRYAWSDRGSDGSPTGEMICHNDLAPWNLVHRPDGGWAFIDWDLAWALLTSVPLMPDSTIPGADVRHRLRVFVDAYGAREVGPDVLDVAVERCEREVALIRGRGAAGEEPYARLLAEGHDGIWAAAAAHVARRAPAWKEEAFSP